MKKNNLLASAKMTSKGQITVPKMIRTKLNLDEGDSVFNTEKLRRAYNSLKHKLVISRFSISALKKQIYMLQTYILKDSIEKFLNFMEYLKTVTDTLKNMIQVR